MSDEHCVPMKSNSPASRDWADLRGEIAVYAMVVAVAVLAVLAHDLTQAIREDIAEKKRLNQRLNADARLIQLAIETADPERRTERDD